MKKILPIAIIATSVLGLGSLTSCQDEDFDVSTAVLQERAFEHGFVKEFGRPSADQSWDFYAQKMQSIRQSAGFTRATMADTVKVIKADTIKQPTDTLFKRIVKEIAYALEEKHDNSSAGQNQYTLTSTGDFRIYAVRYAGGIETDSNYQLDFGLAYIDGNGNEKLVNIFNHGFNTADGFKPTDTIPGTNYVSWGNPGWAAEVQIPKNTRFYFYLKYRYQTNYGWQSQIFYANEIPKFYYRHPTTNQSERSITYDGGASNRPYYGGTSTLLYSAEYVDEETHRDEQIMMIGFEDAWGLNGDYGTENWLDYDFNDIVVFIQGNLPEPSSKRFFAEDKKSFDWDYNDVVFDLSNNGITLRAVGGTLPVFLRVTDRLGKTKVYGELHELLRDSQFNPKNKAKKVTFTRVEDGDEKTYYKPIDVAAYEITGKADESVWLDPIQIVTWTRLGTDGDNFTRLDEDLRELERFSSDPSFPGKAELIVLPEYKSNYDSDKLAMLDEDYAIFDSLSIDKGPLKIKVGETGGIPAMWIGPVSPKWMKEMKKITMGYENFYAGDEWWDTDQNAECLYRFYGDEPD